MLTDFALLLLCALPHMPPCAAFALFQLSGPLSGTPQYRLPATCNLFSAQHTDRFLIYRGTDTQPLGFKRTGVLCQRVLIVDARSVAPWIPVVRGPVW